MTRAELKKRLLSVLEACDGGTAFFLTGVKSAIESLYADDSDNCPDGFEALDDAIEAFEEHEEDSGEGEGEEEEEDDEEEE